MDLVPLWESRSVQHLNMYRVSQYHDQGSRIVFALGKNEARSYRNKIQIQANRNSKYSLERWLGGYENLMLFQGIWVQFPEPKFQALVTLFPRQSDGIVSSPQAVKHKHTCTHIMHVNKNKSFKFLNKPIKSQTTWSSSQVDGRA